MKRGIRFTLVFIVLLFMGCPMVMTQSSNNKIKEITSTSGEVYLEEGVYYLVTTTLEELTLEIILDDSKARVSELTGLAKKVGDNKFKITPSIDAIPLEFAVKAEDSSVKKYTLIVAVAEVTYEESSDSNVSTELNYDKFFTGKEARVTFYDTSDWSVYSTFIPSLPVDSISISSKVPNGEYIAVFYVAGKVNYSDFEEPGNYRAFIGPLSVNNDTHSLKGSISTGDIIASYSTDIHIPGDQKEGSVGSSVELVIYDSGNNIVFSENIPLNDGNYLNDERFLDPGSYRIVYSYDYTDNKDRLVTVYHEESMVIDNTQWTYFRSVLMESGEAASINYLYYGEDMHGKEAIFIYTYRNLDGTLGDVYKFTKSNLSTDGNDVVVVNLPPGDYKKEVYWVTLPNSNHSDSGNYHENIAIISFFDDCIGTSSFNDVYFSNSSIIQ